jgi:drug/metabolite transporter (DMT)-like permease
MTAGLGLWLACFSAAMFGVGTTLALLAFEGGSNPLTIVLLRVGLFLPVVGLMLALLGRLAVPSRQALIGTIWMAGTLAMVSLGYQGSVAFIPVSLAALVFYSFPIMVGLLAAVTRRDRITITKATALMAAFLGLALTLGPGIGVLDWRGIALALLAAIGMALTITFGGKATRDEDALLMSVYTNLWMLVALVIVVIASGSMALPVTRLGAVGAVGLCVTYVISYVCWFLALSAVKPVRLATVSNIEPLVTLLVAWTVLGERLSAVQFVGAALVLAAIFAMMLLRHEFQHE